LDHAAHEDDLVGKGVRPRERSGFRVHGSGVQDLAALRRCRLKLVQRAVADTWAEIADSAA
jgi:hypothetical protein